MNSLPEEKDSLWLVILSPVIWAAHFLLCYITAAIWCAKWAGPDRSFGFLRWAFVGYTAAALLGIGIIGWNGYRRHRHGQSPAPHDSDTPEDRHRFLGYSTFLLSALSAVATLFAGIVAFFFWNCD